MRPSASLVLCLVLPLVWAGAAWGANMNYIGATGSNYDTAANWQSTTDPSVHRVPTTNPGAGGDPSENAYVRNGATVTLNAAEPNVYNLYVGGPSDPSISPPPETVLRILDGAALKTDNSLYVGSAYLGSVYQSGGTLSTPGLLMSQTGSMTSYYSLSGGMLTADSSLRPGGGSSAMYVGGAGGTGRFVQTGGYLSISNSNNFNVGVGYGEFTMSNGTLAVLANPLGGGQQLNVGVDGGRGTFTLNGGQITATYKTQIGYRGTGVFNMTGGVLIACEGVSGGGTPEFGIGYCSTANNGLGVFNLSGGSVVYYRGMRVSTARTAPNDPNAAYPIGILNISGGTILGANTASFSVGYKGGLGTINMTGGSVNVGSMYMADYGGSRYPVAGNTVMTMSGGTLESTGVSIGRNSPASLWISGGSHNPTPNRSWIIRTRTTTTYLHIKMMPTRRSMNRIRRQRTIEQPKIHTTRIQNIRPSTIHSLEKQPIRICPYRMQPHNIFLPSIKITH